MALLDKYGYEYGHANAIPMYVNMAILWPYHWYGAGIYGAGRVLV